MAFDKDLFTGALGKTSKILRSRYAATPNTKRLTNYEVFLTLPKGTTEAFCSLDANTWVYDQDFAAAGVSWVMAPNALIQGESTLEILTNPVPMLIENTLSQYDIADLKYHYSLVTDMVINVTVNETAIGWCIDPYTKETFGANVAASNNNMGCGASNLYNYFPLVNGLSLYGGFATRPMPDCYSLLPPIGDWIMIEDYLLRKTDSPLSDIIEARPLIPLEFNYYPDAASDDEKAFCSFGTGHGNAARRGIDVAASGNMLYARGLMQLGRAFLLPAVIDTNGTALGFYLYIQNTYDITSPYDYFDADTQTEEANAAWLGMTLTALRDPDTGESGVTTFVRDPEDTGKICRRAVTGEVYDAIGQAGIALKDTGVDLLVWDSKNSALARREYKCSTLSKWISPCGASKIQHVSCNGVLASLGDNGEILATDIKNGFFRTRFFADTTPILSAACREDKVALARSGNKIYSQPLGGSCFAAGSIEWGDVYKEAISARVLNYITMSELKELVNRSGLYDKSFDYGSQYPPDRYGWMADGDYTYAYWPSDYGLSTDTPGCPFFIAFATSLYEYMTTSSYYISETEERPYHYHSLSTPDLDLYAIDPEDGELKLKDHKSSDAPDVLSSQISWGMPWWAESIQDCIDLGYIPLLISNNTTVNGAYHHGQPCLFVSHMCNYQPKRQPWDSNIYGRYYAWEYPSWDDGTVLPQGWHSVQHGFTATIKSVYEWTDEYDETYTGYEYSTSQATTIPGVLFKGAHYCPGCVPTDAAQASFNARVDDSQNFYFMFQEVSSNMPIAVKVDLNPLGSTKFPFDEGTNARFEIKLAAVQGKDPVPCWRGAQKFLKNFFLFRITWGSVYRQWGSPYGNLDESGVQGYVALRVDLSDPEVFDFDAEVLRSNRRPVTDESDEPENQEQEGDV